MKSKSTSTGLVYHASYLRHYTGRSHPERAERLLSIMKKLDAEGITERVELLSPVKASREQIEYVHQGAYISKVEVMSARGGGMLDPDTPICPDSFEIALLAAGGVLKAVDTIMEEPTMKHIFALVRPPGHHATSSRGMGFCIFNNIAIAAEHLKREYGIKRILIADWDVHHGNGTQEAFLNDPSVLYFSLHQYPYYPGTGWLTEVGKGAGEGYTINVPLPSGTDDGGYLYALNNLLMPVAREFKPDFVLVSAGFDPHVDDPLASMKVTSHGFGLFTDVIKEIAAENSNGKLVITLEGGYNLSAIAESVSAVFNSLLAGTDDKDENKDKHREAMTPGEVVKNRVEEVRDVLSRYWSMSMRP